MQIGLLRESFSSDSFPNRSRALCRTASAQLQASQLGSVLCSRNTRQASSHFTPDISLTVGLSVASTMAAKANAATAPDSVGKGSDE